MTLVMPSSRSSESLARTAESPALTSVLPAARWADSVYMLRSRGERIRTLQSRREQTLKSVMASDSVRAYGSRIGTMTSLAPDCRHSFQGKVQPDSVCDSASRTERGLTVRAGAQRDAVKVYGAGALIGLIMGVGLWASVPSLDEPSAPSPVSVSTGAYPGMR